MKKYFILSVVAIFSFSAIIGCNDRNDDVVVPEPITAVMTDVTGSLNVGNSYAIEQGINLNSTDVVLVYRRLSDSWQLIPKTVYLDDVVSFPTNRKFDYNFVFDTQTVQIRIDDNNFNLPTEITTGEAAEYFNNQRFRIVLIPALQGKNAQVDYRDYESVLKFYNIPDRD
ncbi:hypothetical protein FNJ88_05295 [Chryseobacterium sp. SNU WT5]|uniref:hypothetical protein n=1 Tax=Chryseobacterium sp. SNU WT5 TaxID=2594269 RepID=UPI00117ECBA7|nr:hypothetical protein [Chryseobacterium sp. SNU WT5]QDP85000.1 hypothetical protein FNJ88_05295 [Chryseobacterium sp. SNU WT5]